MENQSRHLRSDNWRSGAAPNASPGHERHRGDARERFDSQSFSHRGQSRASRPQEARTAMMPRPKKNGQRGEPVSGVSGPSSALAEGRRIYIGNLAYAVRPEQISEALSEQGFSDLEQIHISIDPITGRNPGYCFAEFETCETAEAAIEAMAGVRLANRPIKTGPCQPKQQQSESHKPLFTRWGDWGQDAEAQAQATGQGPLGAEQNIVKTVQTEFRHRVFVGGLGIMVNQTVNDQELRAIFDGFAVVAISKRITPYESTRAKPGKHHYNFVDLESEQEADRAVEVLNGRLWQGSRLKVRRVLDPPQEIIARAEPWDGGKKLEMSDLS